MCIMKFNARDYIHRFSKIALILFLIQYCSIRPDIYIIIIVSHAHKFDSEYTIMKFRIV